MNRILVSHECPVSILENSLEFNDYQYCLVHLMEENEKYRDWFTEKYRSLRPNGEILLDNSIFELGESFKPEEYAVWADKIKPNFLIVPDVLEDNEATIHSYEEFSYYDVPGKRIGVVQGKTWTQVVECYEYMSERADYIAISFDFSMYNVTGFGTNRLERCSSGRQQLVKRLISEGYWNWDKPHHLLGCSLAREFAWYRKNNIHNIRSIDTSNPVTVGIEENYYNSDFGMDKKPKLKLFEQINHEVNDDELDAIYYNTKMFDKIVNGVNTKYRHEV